MAIFQPRTFNEIVADMIARLLASTPLTDLNYGSVWTTMLEAAAQEDDEQYFQMLEIVKAFSLDNTTGTDLDDRAYEYGLTRRAAQKASSIVTIGDSAITRVATGVYSGKPGPVAGATIIYADDSTGFGPTGSVIIGRNTPNAETVAYTSITPFPNYVAFNLSIALAHDHGTDEEVVLSQGGNRTITAGLVVYVPASDINPKIDYSISQPAVILDGEQEVTNVPISASEAGAKANVPIGAVSLFDSSPFATATVTNPQRITNGSDEETDQELRDRIKATIQSLSRGTGRSIISSVLGIVSEEQNKRVVSASLVEPTVPVDVVKLFIDDGTGFIPTYTNIGFEEIVASATGGEKFLRLNNVPVMKAFVETQNQEPYDLTGGEILFVEVGGEVETVTFVGTDFEVPGAATAQEVLSRLNSSASLFEARISSTGKKVRIFSRSNFGEEITVTGGTANTDLNFPTDDKYTTKVYLERDYATQLLSKDGKTASLEAVNAANYDLSSYTRALVLAVDGKLKNPIDVFFDPAWFSNPTLVGSQEICNVINAVSPAITAEPSSNNTKFRIASNMERSGNSKLRVIGTFDKVWNTEGGILVDRTAAARTGGFQAFGTDGDYLYVGHLDVPFDLVSCILSINSSDVLNTIFEIYTASGWQEIGADDQTGGFAQTGIIAFGRDPRWSKVSVNGSGQMYWFRMKRNQGFVTIPPTFSHLMISSANVVFGFSETESVGSNKDYTLNRFIGQIELEIPLESGDRITCGSVETRPYVVAQNQERYALNNGDVFSIDVDGINQTYTFQTSDFFSPGSALAAEVKAALEAHLVGVTISLVSNNQKIKIATNKMNGGTLKVNTCTANSALNFPTTLVSSLIAHIPAVECVTAEPYVFPINCQLVVIIDGNNVNSFLIPCYYQGTLTGVTSGSEITDTGLFSIFNSAIDLAGYDVVMIDGPAVGIRKSINTYNPSTGLLTLGSAFSPAPVTGNKYQILPATADQVVRLWNNKLVTTVSTKAVISASGGGRKVQIASQGVGESASVLISGGTGNTILNFPTTTKFGVDGYRYFTGLAQKVQWTVDGNENDQENYPGIRAAGVQVEVMEPVIKPITVEINVTTREGVTLLSIQNDVKSAISNYINTLPVGGDVISSEIIVATKGISGVFDVRILNLAPKPSGVDNVPIADNELPRISEENIIVG